MTQRHTFITLCLLALAACTNAAETSNATAESLNAWKNDTGNAWSQLFTYNPKPRTPQPASTRYCYQFASDIVCYDNPQPHLTAKLVGVQGGEGPRIIVYQTPQPAGYMQSTPAPLFPSDPVVAAPMDISQPVMPPTGATLGTVNGKTIQARDIPAPFAKKTP